MPASSKQQQKFMGIVHAIQKGDIPASDASPEAQKVAQDMKPSDVKDFASTSHKGLPKKVKQEILKKLKEYAMSLPGHHAKPAAPMNSLRSDDEMDVNEDRVPQNFSMGTTVRDYHTKLATTPREEFDDTNFRKDNSGQPDLKEGDDKLEMLKLFNKALKMMPGSPKQKEVIKQLNVIRTRNGLKPLNEKQVVNKLAEYASKMDLSYIPNKDANLDGTPEDKDAIDKKIESTNEGQINEWKLQLDLGKVNPSEFENWANDSLQKKHKIKVSGSGKNWTIVGKGNDDRMGSSSDWITQLLGKAWTINKIKVVQKESVNEATDTNSLKKIHDGIFKFLKTKKGVGEVKEFSEFPNRYGDNVSTFSVKYNIEDKYNYDLQEIKIEYSTSRVFIPNKGYFPFKTFNDIKNIINKKSSLQESVNEAKTYKKGDKLKIKLKNGKKFDVVFVDYSRTKGIAYGKFKDGGEVVTKPFSLDLISESVNEVGIGDWHFKAIQQMYQKAGSFGKKKIAALITKNPNSPWSKIEKELRGSDYDEVTYYTDKLHLESVNEELSFNEKQMVIGIIEILKQVDDRKNRMKIALNMLKKFEDEGIVFDYQKFVDALKEYSMGSYEYDKGNRELGEAMIWQAKDMIYKIVPKDTFTRYVNEPKKNKEFVDSIVRDLTSLLNRFYKQNDINLILK